MEPSSLNPFSGALNRAAALAMAEGAERGLAQQWVLFANATLATALSEDPGTLEEVHEPYLIRQGLLKRTPRGRVATELAYRHLGYPPPVGPLLEP